MTLVLAKDRPWIVFLAVAGTIACTAGLLEVGGPQLFVVGATHLEATFHVAWIAGLVLGAVAACFDEALGTRELLAQRPLARRSIVAARLRAVALVLAVWAVVSPAVALAAFALGEQGVEHTRLRALAPLLATFAVAASAAGIGLAAGSLPAPWWQRLVFAGIWFALGFGLVDALARDDAGSMRLTPFVVGHGLLAAYLTWVAASGGRHDADADRPMAPMLRWTTFLPAAAALAALYAAVAREGQSVAFAGLDRAYPEIVRRGDDHLLVTRRDQSLRRNVVDRDHQPTGAVLQGSAEVVEPVERAWLRWWTRGFGFDAPRWRSTAEAGSFGYQRVLLAGDGSAFVRHLRDGIRPTGRGAELAPFAAGSQVGDVGDGIVAVDAASQTAWRFDAAQGWFVPLAMPAGERALRLERVHLQPERDRELIDALAVPSRPYQTHGFLRGDLAAYVLRGTEPVAVPGLQERAAAGVGRIRDLPRENADPLVFTVRLPAAGPTGSGFEHEFRPRTTVEWLHGGTAMAWSLVRPPLLQVTGSFVPMPARASWLFDGLTSDGRRPWLVFATCLLAGALAWRTSRRLQSLGAARATVRGWTVAVALLGLPALLVSLAIERPRAYARRDVAVPPPPPRIVSPSPAEVPA